MLAVVLLQRSLSHPSLSSLVRVGRITENMSTATSKSSKKRKGRPKQQKSTNEGDKNVHKREPKVVKTSSQKAWEDFRVQSVDLLRTHRVLSLAFLAVSILLSALYFAVDGPDGPAHPPITDVVRLRFETNGTDLGVVEFGLFGYTCPLTTKNFIMLATHEKGYGYKGSRIHMIVPMHAILGGDITKGDGTGGRSALTQPFEKESFLVRHAAPGYLGMQRLENNEKSNRTSIFYVTTHAVPSYDGVQVAFGIVLSGMDVITTIQSSEVDDNMVPAQNITISDTAHSILYI